MEDNDIMQLWKAYDSKLEQSLVLNTQHASAITGLKIQSMLSSMKPVKLLAVVVGIAWVCFVDTLIYHVFYFASPFFIVAAIAQVLLTKLAIGIYLYQLILLQQVNLDEPILQTQARIGKLISSTLWIPRLLFLQLPLWTIFYWNKSMLVNGNMGLLIVQAVISISFLLLAAWLFYNINEGNRHKKWFRLLFSGAEWAPVIKSMELLDQLKEIEKR